MCQNAAPPGSSPAARSATSPTPALGASPAAPSGPTQYPIQPTAPTAPAATAPGWTPQNVVQFGDPQGTASGAPPPGSYAATGLIGGDQAPQGLQAAQAAGVQRQQDYAAQRAATMAQNAQMRGAPAVPQSGLPPGFQVSGDPRNAMGGGIRPARIYSDPASGLRGGNRQVIGDPRSAMVDAMLRRRGN